MLFLSPVTLPTSSFSLTPDCCPASRISLLALHKKGFVLAWPAPAVRRNRDLRTHPLASHHFVPAGLGFPASPNSPLLQFGVQAAEKLSGRGRVLEPQC